MKTSIHFSQVLQLHQLVVQLAQQALVLLDWDAKIVLMAGGEPPHLRPSCRAVPEPHLSRWQCWIGRMAQFVRSGRAFRMRWCRLCTTLTIVRVEEIFIVEHHSCLGVILERDRAGLTNWSVCYFHYQRRRQRWVGRKNELLEDDADRGVCEPAFQKLKLWRLWMLPREVGEGDEGNVLAQSVEAAVYPLSMMLDRLHSAGGDSDREDVLFY
uniref:Uncharacterized protein n=1 Tax=Anopheles merus TaxID=30066 RepID=A0A182VK86_ANOME